MSVTEQGGKVPLYMVTLQGILRKMAEEAGGTAFDYQEFRKRSAAEDFTKEQLGPLALRLGILESFMVEMTPKATVQQRERMAKA